MTSKETCNVIQVLKSVGLNGDQIVTAIEFIESSDIEILEKLKKELKKEN